MAKPKPTADPPERRKRGPKPEHLKLGGDWENAVKAALKKHPPPRPKSAKKKDGQR